MRIPTLENYSITWCLINKVNVVVDGFKCTPCDGTIQEADLAEDLMVDGETWI